MKTLFKKTVSLFIAFVLMLSLCVTTYFAADGDVVEGVVINTDDTSVVSNIKIDVYSLTSVYTDSSQTDYDKQFAFSVFTDSNGEFSFTKPTSQCVVEIDETTVADGYGVLTGADILGADKITAELSISALATYEIDFEDNSIQFYNAQDDALVVKENLNSDALTDVQLRSTDPEPANLLAEDDLAPVGAPAYSDEGIYTNGFFTYHYEKGVITEADLLLTANEFNNAKAALCNVYGFPEPIPSDGDGTYDIYFVEITGNQSAGGSTPLISNGSSFIKIKYINRKTENNTIIYDYYLSCVPHELMHAIQNTYLNYDNGSADYWAFNEAVAELAAYLCICNPNSTYRINEDNVNSFLNSPEQSLLTYSGRAYGSVLFPMYLHDTYNGMNTIKLIYEEYSRVPNIYTALDNVLSEVYNSSLIETYIDFTISLYDIRANYNCEDEFPNVLSGVNNTTKKTVITEDIITYSTPKLSTVYFEKESDEDMYFTFYFALQGTTTASQVNLTSIYTSPDGEVTVTEYPFNTNLKMVNVDMEEGSKICFLMSNITTNTDTEFYCCVYE